jgi:outer membrane protein OmpA-like peptidoglycan-associated protein
MSEDKSAPEKSEAGDEVNDSAAAHTKPSMPPTMVLAFVIIALLGVLIVMGLRGGFGSGSAGSSDLTQLQAEANAIRGQLNRERMSMGLRPLESGSESAEDIATRLKKDADTMAALATSLESMLGEKDAAISAKNSELLRSEQLRQSLAAESSRLQAELQRALVASSEVDRLRREFDALRSQRDALSAELAAKGGSVSADEFDEFQRRLDEALRAKDFFENRVKELEAELAKARLFASSESELLPAAVELFRNLRELENRPDSDLTSAYSGFGVKLGANVLHTLTFPTGLSGLTPADEEIIARLGAEIPDGDLMLVVGYASETGNVDSNRTLSSDRATAVAQKFSSIKRPSQLVQAVYLGQTDRFSSRIPERNQLCEIWRIRKK